MKNLNLIFAWVCLLFISTACNDVEPSISSLPVPTSKPYSNPPVPYARQIFSSGHNWENAYFSDTLFLRHVILCATTIHLH